MKKYEIENKVFDESYDKIILDEILSNKKDYKAIVVGAKLGTIVQQDYRFVVVPIVSTDIDNNMYKIGVIDDTEIYVDPWLKWEDWSVTYVYDSEGYIDYEKETV